MKIAIFTVIYKGLNKEYFKKFLLSIEMQTFKEFTILIINDGFNNIESFIEYLKIPFKIINMKKNISISKVREEGFNACLNEGYDYIIFCDSDDYFSKSRVEVLVNELDKGNDIVVNNMNIVNNYGKMIKENYFEELNDSDLGFKDIINKNYFGLSNTAINAYLLKYINKIPKDIAVVDWYVFSILTYKTSKIKYINESLTFYRQYSNNFVGINNNYTYDYILKGINVKIQNYFYLMRFFESLDDIVFRKYYKKYKKFMLLKSNIKDNTIFYNKYLNKIKEHQRINAWWDDIIYVE